MERHKVRHLQRELAGLKKRILALGATVEDRVHKTVKAIDSRDVYDAKRIIREDYEIDETEVEVEEECLKILALHQPVAVDLRFIIAAIKINNDLERIGDEAVNVAQRILTISKTRNPPFEFSYTEMGNKAKSMLRMSLDSLVGMDSDLAFKVCLMDDEVDKIRSFAYDKIKEIMSSHPECTGYLVNLMLISRHLERVADHATNIAEEVIYLIEGEIIRHGNY